MILRKLKLLALFFLTLSIGVAFVLSVFYEVQSFTGIGEGIFDWIKSQIYDYEENFTPLLFQVLSIILFSISASLFYILFFSGINLLILRKTEGFKRAVQWELYKYFHSFLPFGIVGTAAIAIAAASILYFNQILTAAGISLGLTTFIFTFVGLNTIFFLAGAAVFSLWQLVKLSSGTKIAINEPELDNKTIAARLKN